MCLLCLISYSTVIFCVLSSSSVFHPPQRWLIVLLECLRVIWLIKWFYFSLFFCIYNCVWRDFHVWIIFNEVVDWKLRVVGFCFFYICSRGRIWYLWTDLQAKLSRDSHHGTLCCIQVLLWSPHFRWLEEVFRCVHVGVNWTPTWSCYHSLPPCFIVVKLTWQLVCLHFLNFPSCCFDLRGHSLDFYDNSDGTWMHHHSNQR